MARYNFAVLLDTIDGKPFLPDAQQIVESEYSRTRAEVERSGRNRQPRDFAAENYFRQIKGLLFYFQSCRKADGLRPEEFKLLQPLAERWVEMKQLDPNVMDEFKKHFGSLTDSA